MMFAICMPNKLPNVLSCMPNKGPNVLSCMSNRTTVCYWAQGQPGALSHRVLDIFLLLVVSCLR
jgi:hypothetical protein